MVDGHKSTAARGASGRSRIVAFGLLALGSLAALALASQSWWSVPSTTTTVTGNDATRTLAGVLAGAAAAGTGLAALAGRMVRTLLGGLLALLALAMIVVGVVAEPGVVVTGGWTESVAAPPRPTGVAYAYLAAAVLTLGGAMVLTICARLWPERPDRFARGAGRASTTAEDDAGEVWKALDAGFDPTATDWDGGTVDSTGRKRPNTGE